MPNLDFASLFCHWNASLSWLPQASCITSANALEAARRPSAGRLQSKKDPQLPTLCLFRLHISIRCRKKVPRAPHTADLVSRKQSSGIAFCQYHCGMKNFKRQNWGEEKKYSDTRKAIQTVATWKNDRYFRPFLLSSGQKALYVPQLRRGREREREIYIYIHINIYYINLERYYIYYIYIYVFQKYQYLPVCFITILLYTCLCSLPEKKKKVMFLASVPHWQCLSHFKTISNIRSYLCAKIRWNEAISTWRDKNQATVPKWKNICVKATHQDEPLWWVWAEWNNGFHSAKRL